MTHEERHQAQGIQNAQQAGAQGPAGFDSHRGSPLGEDAFAEGPQVGREAEQKPGHGEESSAVLEKIGDSCRFVVAAYQADGADKETEPARKGADSSPRSGNFPSEAPVGRLGIGKVFLVHGVLSMCWLSTLFW